MTKGSVTVQGMYTLTVLGNDNRDCYCSGYVYTLTVLGNDNRECYCLGYVYIDSIGKK